MHWSLGLRLLSAFCLLLAVRGLDPKEACPLFPVDGNPEKVVGREAPADARPWVVLLWVTCSDVNNKPMLPVICDGSIIGTDWVLTVASCFPCGNSASVVVDVGLKNSDIRVEMANNKPVERVGADGVFVHPFYDAFHHKNDLALVHLAREVNESRVIEVVNCEEKSVEPGREGVSSGWGTTPSYSLLDPKPMQDAFVVLWPSESCNVALGSEANGMICAGVKQYTWISSFVLEKLLDSVSSSPSVNDEPCYVEQGSSLSVLQPRIHQTYGNNSSVQIICKWQLYGVLSFGLPCGQTAFPGFYTDVCQFRNWITDTKRTQKERLMNLEGCPALPEPPLNGYLCGLEDTMSGKVKFCCERGYQISGPSTTYCDRQLGKWKQTAGACEPVKCPALPTPDFGESSPVDCGNSSYQMGCWFSCDRGYKLKGKCLLTCTEDGTWTGHSPNCKPVDCGPPPSGGNLLVEYTQTTFNASALYYCKRCYHMQHGKFVKRHCSSIGKWEGDIPVCQLTRCPQLVPPRHGRIIQSTDICGTEVRFQCNNGFLLAGFDRAVCQEDGQWSNPSPLCTANHCLPPIVKASSNYDSVVSSLSLLNITYGDSITIDCKSCRKPVGGSVNLTCMEGGYWDKEPPSCEWVTCPLQHKILNGQVFPLGQLYFCGTTVRFRCYPKFKLVGASSTICGIDGNWSQPFPNCESLNPDSGCQELAVAHGSVSYTSTGFGATAMVSCEECFYRSDGSDALICKEDGQWSGHPKCRRIMCPKLLPPSNGRLIQQGKLGNNCKDLVFFECDSGYQLEGPRSLTCLRTGKWSNLVPTCKNLVMKCPQPPTPLGNSYVCSSAFSGSSLHSNLPSSPVGTILPGTIIRYCCNDQVETLECLSSGAWNATLHRCDNPPLEHSCKAPIPPSNGKLIQHDSKLHYEVGVKLEYTCNDGYKMAGSDVSECMSNETWSSDPPQCFSVSCLYTCPFPVTPSNGKILNLLKSSQSTVGGVDEGTLAIFVCDFGYYLHGSASRVCMANGVWSGQEPFCLTFISPRSRFIVRHATDNQWQSSDIFHFDASQSVYLACQTDGGAEGAVQPIKKIVGPELELDNVRVIDFGDQDQNQQLLLQPLNINGAMSISGTYQCDVSSQDNEDGYSRYVEIIMHETFCPILQDVPNGKIKMNGFIPGSCCTVTCDSGYMLRGSIARQCGSDGRWIGLDPMCESA